MGIGSREVYKKMNAISFRERHSEMLLSPEIRYREKNLQEVVLRPTTVRTQQPGKARHIFLVKLRRWLPGVCSRLLNATHI